MGARDWPSLRQNLVIAGFERSLASGYLEVGCATAIHPLHDNFVLLATGAQVGHDDRLVIKSSCVCLPDESLSYIFYAAHFWLELEVCMDLCVAGHRISCLEIGTLLRSFNVIEVDGDYLLA